MMPQNYKVEKHEPQNKTCPFCPGNEKMTPPEVSAHRKTGTKPDTPGWTTRTVPNKFPALKSEGDLARAGVGMFDMMNGIGAHEVIIENPDHAKQLADLADHEMELVIWAYRERSVDLRGDKRFKYMLIFKNFGLSAGASLEHSHSQLIALPAVPKTVREELLGCEKYFEYKDRCLICDIIREELQAEERIVSENNNFVAYCPIASRFPFEVWIAPKEHSSDFTYINKEAMMDLGRIIIDILKRVRVVLGDPSYNYLLHTSPIEARERPDYHWHIELMPKLAKVAGFEWGSGFYINRTSPETAAKYLREAKI
jgi:UDPglucose--hexose-1-phosphate uridylyltransferase